MAIRVSVKGKRFIVHADEKLTAFVELASGNRAVPAKSGMTAGY
jgi:hypothetical protein